VSTLSLDLARAFNNVSYNCLLKTILKKGLPLWVLNIVRAFLKNRTTSLLFDGQTSQLFPTETGIPQGSPLSPILFLLFISPLLEATNKENRQGVSLSFVDNTNLMVWSPSARRNCQLLEGIHKVCLDWARKSGASFALDKYQLIHLSQKKASDLTACISIPGFSREPQKSLKVLGVWLDQQLNWKLHIQKAAEKGDKQLRALARIAGSTWGLDFEKTRLLYNTTVRSSFCHRAQVWALGDQG